MEPAQAATTSKVKLPDGRIVPDVPRGTSQTVLYDTLVRAGQLDSETATSWLNTAREEIKLSRQPQRGQGGPQGAFGPAGPPTPLGADPRAAMPPAPVGSPITNELRGSPPSYGQGGASMGQTVEDIGGAVGRNMDIPGGIAGAALGAKLGTVGGLPGMVGGGIVGGGIGTFGGSIATDYIESGEPDFSEASKDSLISMGFDVATLGTLKLFKPAARAMGFGPEEISALWGKLSKTVDPKALPVGSSESLQQTQNLLQESGGSLRAAQAAQQGENRIGNVAEALSEVGVGSGGYYKRLDATNTETIANRLQSMMNDAFERGALETDRVGAYVYGAIQGGRKAATALYGKGMKEITQKYGLKRVNAANYWLALNKFRATGDRSFGSIYGEETLKFVDEWMGTLGKLDTMPVSDITDLQKVINDKIRNMGAFDSPAEMKRAARELAELSKAFRETTYKSFSNINPQLGENARQLNADYGKAMDGLLPELNKSSIVSGSKEAYEGIAVSLRGKNPDTIKKFLTSIDVAYEQAAKEGLDMTTVGGVATAKEAKAVIKAGYLKSIFGETPDTLKAFTTGQRNLAVDLEKNSAAVKLILGEDYNTYKMLVNALNESSRTQGSGIGSLVLRSKEAGAAGDVGQIALGGSVAVASSLFAGLSIFLGPVLLRKMVSSPAAVRRLIAGNKRISAATAAGKVASVSTIVEETLSGIMGSFNEEEQAEIRQSMRQQ